MQFGSVAPILNLTNVDFTGNTAQYAGGAIYSDRGIITITAAGADVLFSNNKGIGGSSTTPNDIYLSGGSLTLDAQGANKITFSDGISGSSNTYTINKIGSGELILSGNNTNNFGTFARFNQTAGTTTVTGKFFNGISTINGGFLNFNTNGELTTSSTGTPSLTLNSGAVMNLNDGALIDDSSFTSTTIAVNSGAILNINNTSTPLDFNALLSGAGTIYKGFDGVTNFTKDNSGFTGNFYQEKGISNALNNFFDGTSYIQGGILNFQANSTLSNGAHIYLTDSTMNIGQIAGDPVTLNTGSTIDVGTNSRLNFKTHINEGSKFPQHPSINLNNGIIVMDQENYMDDANLGIYGGILNTQNGMIGTMALNNVAFGGTSSWLMDVDLANVIGDKISSATPVTGAGNLNISGIRLFSDANAVATAITVADTNTKNNVSTSVTSVNGALFKYAVSYDSSGSSGVLNFLKIGVSPNAVASDVAQTSTFLLQTAIDRQFFGNVDSFMSFPLAQRESSICCALNSPTANNSVQAVSAACPVSGNGIFSPIYSCELNKGIWAKSFVSFEDIPLRNGPRVATIEYGTLIGGDAPLKYLKRGFVGNTSGYVGYLGSNQNFDNVGVSQNGIIIGLAENMVRKNLFLTTMASVGSSLAESNNRWGTDNFSSLFTGVAEKAGYNFEFKRGEYIIQPNLMLAYTFTNTPNYHTSSGLRMDSKPLNAIQVAPGIRLIKNFREEKGQVYLLTNFVYNILDKTNFTANDVELPQLSIAPYVEYGFGFQRVWKERITGFAQTLLRGGGRNGIALQFGLRVAI